MQTEIFFITEEEKCSCTCGQGLKVVSVGLSDIKVIKHTVELSNPKSIRHPARGKMKCELAVIQPRYSSICHLSHGSLLDHGLSDLCFIYFNHVCCLGNRGTQLKGFKGFKSFTIMSIKYIEIITCVLTCQLMTTDIQRRINNT